MSWEQPPEGPITEHFDWREAACRHCGRVPDREAVEQTAKMMEAVREKLGGRPVKVLSWCRCPVHNAAVGGAPDSFHKTGQAVDFVVKGLTPGQVQAMLAGHVGGMGKYKGFTHIDRGPTRRWTG